MPRLRRIAHFVAVSAIIALAAPHGALAEVSLPDLFSPGMVLQRDQPAPVWGWAEPGETVTVEIAGQEHTTQADAEGAWQVRLAPLSRSEHPKALTLSVSGKNRVVIENVQLGDVWLVAGGERVLTQIRMLPESKTLLAESPAAPIRFLIVKSRVAKEPQRRTEGSWQTYDKNSLRLAPALAYLLADELHASRDVPIGVIVAGLAYPETPLETWIRRAALEKTAAAKPILDFYAADGWNRKANESYAKRLAAWKEALQKLPLDPPPKPEPGPRKDTSRLEPGVAYNGTLAPLAPFALRGIVWDHGENDHSLTHAVQYGELLPALIESFRTAWQRPDLPVVVVQLRAGRHGKFDDRCGAELREAQDRVLALSHTRSVVTVDLGPQPSERQVAARVARAAQAAVGSDPSQAAEPRLKSATVEGNRVVLQFDHAPGGLVVRGEKPQGFALASSIYRWVWADVEIDGDRIILSAPTVDQPVGVRYAYQDRPEQKANIYNQAGQPLAPFRTDDHTPYTAGLKRPDAMARYMVRAALNIEDPRLPRVLIIGDSISGGYQMPLVEALRGKANVIGEAELQSPWWPSCGPVLYKTEFALRDDRLRRHLTEREPYDVIHFNMGIHEFAAAKPGWEKSYANRLRKVVEVMQKHSDAKLIWCSSTGTISDNLIPRFPLYLSNCQRFNAAAESVMKEYGVAINDLYGFTQPQIKQVISGDHIHFRAEAKIAQAQFLAKLILEQLQETDR